MAVFSTAMFALVLGAFSFGSAGDDWPEVPSLSMAAFDEAFVDAARALVDSEPGSATDSAERARRAAPVGPLHDLLTDDCGRLLRLTPAEAATLLRCLDDGSEKGAEAIEPGLLGRAFERRALRIGDVAIDSSTSATDPLRENRLACADAAVRLSSAASVETAAHAKLARGALRATFGLHQGADGRRIVDDVNDAATALAHTGFVLEHAYALFIAGVVAEKNDESSDALARFGIAIHESESRSRPLFVEALAHRLILDCRLAHEGDAKSDAERLEAALAAQDANRKGTITGVAWFALGTWHGYRRPEDDERSNHRHEQAVDAWTNAIENFPEARDGALARVQRSNMLANLGRFAEAHEDLDQAAAIFDRLGLADDSVHCIASRAWVEYREGKPESCLKTLDEERARLDPSKPSHLRRLRYNVETRAFAARRLGNAKVTEEALLTMIAIEDEMLAKAAPGYALYEAEEAVETHGFLVQQLCDGSGAEGSRDERFLRATAAIEHGRARVLRTALNARGGQAPPAAHGVPPPKFGALPEGVAELRWFVSRALPPVETDHERDHYVLLGRFRAERIFADLGAAEEVDAAVGRFLDDWMTERGLTRSADEYEHDVRALTARLLGPACAWFEGEHGPDRLLVMPDGMIERVPFDALLAGKRGPEPGFAGLPFLVKKVAIARVPSLAILDALARPNREPAVLAALDPVVRSDSPPPLRFASVEGAALRRSFRDVRVLERSEATSEALRTALAERAVGWLHLGTHARRSSGHEHSASALLFASSGEGTGWLECSALESLPITRGARVVLSACGTADGDLHRGEGVLGIWRAFLLAGASCVVSTLRDVDDRCTAAWMSSFYASAARGVPIADAMRDASRHWLRGEGVPAFPRGSLLKDFAHPAAWAAWVCVGDDGGAMPGRP
ncbi:MAG: CHAT domain-containing protein [Planctomycetes bacterium]|nr:CHAT domain-containing protein [Planctomycetota bacterium]